MYEMRIDYKNTIPSNHTAHTELQTLDTAEFQLKHCGATAVVVHHISFDEPRTYVLDEAGNMVWQRKLPETTSDNIVVSRKMLEKVIHSDIEAMAFLDIAIAEGKNNGEKTKSREKSRAHVNGRKTVLEAILRGRYSADE